MKVIGDVIAKGVRRIGDNYPKDAIIRYYEAPLDSTCTSCNKPTLFCWAWDSNFEDTIIQCPPCDYKTYTGAEAWQKAGDDMLKLLKNYLNEHPEKALEI